VSSPPRLVLATQNAAKGAELASLLAGVAYRIETLAAHPAVVLPPEGTTSYAANALDKARAAASGTACVAVGDDSGLEVDALGGGPGVASARYGGPDLDDGGRLRRLLAALPPAGPRTARFRCLLALVAPWGEEHVVEGVVEGVLTAAPRGAGGFGYDPIFLIPVLGHTFGEMSPDDKARWSHRARAVAGARPILAGWAPRAARVG
jgi:XTP/dITP diphosphohydrolase